MIYMKVIKMCSTFSFVVKKIDGIDTHTFTQVDVRVL